MRIFVMQVLFAVLSFTAFAQKGKIEGKITDARTGNPLAGISVLIKETISSTSYEGKELNDIELGNDGIAHVEVALSIKAKSGEAVIIKSSSARKETVNALITYQKNTAVVAQVISAEAIKRSPDKNTGEVLKRVTGTSVQEGKYLVVRGLSDRYNQAMLNGILLSSTEPDRKTFSFDIFPSAMIDNIIMNKTFIPELPGEWAGGLVQVQTKDVPAASFLNVQVGTGFNSNTIGKDFFQAPGSKTDCWVLIMAIEAWQQIFLLSRNSVHLLLLKKRSMVSNSEIIGWLLKALHH